MSAVAGPLWVFAALLGVAGVLKSVSPQATQGALRQSGLPSSRLAVRMLGAGETAVAAWAIATGTAAAGALVAAFYLGFVAFLSNALIRNLPIASCGCFGKEDTPPGWIHVAITILGFITGVVTVLTPPGSPPDFLGSLEASPLLFLLLTGIAFAFAYMSLTALPKTLAAAKSLDAESRL